jgi:hypothetical protein
MPTELIPTTYDALREEVMRLLLAGKERARQAVEREKTRTYWEVGRLLHRHLEQHGQRAAYGEQVMSRLAADLEMDRRRLYEMLRVYRAFPIVRATGQLTWTHYLTLLKVPSAEARSFYFGAARQKGWSVRQLEEAIRAERFALAAPAVRPKGQPPLLQARRGWLYAYRLVESQGPGRKEELALDLGFALRRRVELRGIDHPQPGLVVESRKRGKGYAFAALELKRDRLYTFAAVVRDVVDGDTLVGEIDCGFDCRLVQRLRLRGLDAPELSAPQGQRARAFVEEALEKVLFVVVKTFRPDKYGRYLADLFYLEGADDPRQVAAEGVFLNRQLLEEGLARPFTRA